MEPFYTLMGQRIKLARKRSGTTQLALAQALGISRPSVANMETGRQRIYAHHIYDISLALRVPPSRIMPPIKQRDWLILVGTP